MKKTFTTYAVKTQDDVLLFNGKYTVINYLYNNHHTIDLKAILVQQFITLDSGMITIKPLQELTFNGFANIIKKFEAQLSELSGREFEALLNNASAFIVNQIRQEAQALHDKKYAFIKQCVDSLIDIDML